VCYLRILQDDRANGENEQLLEKLLKQGLWFVMMMLYVAVRTEHLYLLLQNSELALCLTLEPNPWGHTTEVEQ
jgi:hypothetical protein